MTARSLSRAPIAGVFACLAAILLVAAAPCQAKIRVIKQWYANGPGGLAWSHIKIETTIDPDAIEGSGPPTISSEIAYPGTMTAVAPENKEIVTNKAQTIVAINFRPAVEATDLYLLVQSSDGQLLVLNDLNDRIDHLCKRQHKDFESGDLRAYKIVGDKLYLTSTSEGVVTYFWDLTVSVSPTGALRLISYDAGNTQELEKSGRSH